MATYSPPARSVCDQVTFYAQLVKPSRLAVALQCYRGKIVHFSIEQQQFVDAEWRPVYRIDSRRSVHSHQFNQAGEDVDPHRLITPIPASWRGQQVVHDAYTDAYLAMVSNWEDHLRTWRQE